MRAHEANKQGPLTSANDDVEFVLEGGHYQVAAQATWSGGSATLETLGPDGQTWMTVATAFTADGLAVYYFAPGKFRWTVATSTAVYVSVVRIPGE